MSAQFGKTASLPVSCNRIAQFLGHREAQTGHGMWRTAIIHNKIGASQWPTPLVNPAKIASFLKPELFGKHYDSRLSTESFSALCASSLQNFLPILGAHSGQETMNSLVHSSFGLIGAFHFNPPLLHTDKKACKWLQQKNYILNRPHLSTAYFIFRLIFLQTPESFPQKLWKTHFSCKSRAYAFPAAPKTSCRT